MNPLQTPGWTGCAANMIAFWAILFLVNVPAPYLGLKFDSEAPDVWLSPPGWLVVAAWIVLFPALGAARWLVRAAGTAGASRTARLIVALAVLCASYAYYTLGFEKLTGVSAAIFGLAGNAVVIAVAVWTAVRANGFSRAAAILVGGVAVWTAFASISVVQIVFPR